MRQSPYETATFTPTNQPSFYLVWNPTGRAPIVRHIDYVTAQSEAVRLSRLNPGQEFFVLRADARVQLPLAQPNTVRLV